MSKRIIQVPAGATEVIVDTIAQVSTQTVITVPDAGVSFTIAQPPQNTAPTAGAGADATITLPTNTVNLVGTATDVDGVVTKTEWSKISGPAATITDPTSAKTTATGLVAGSYIFRFTATDDDGSSSYDESTVIVNPEVVVTPGYTLTKTIEFKSSADLNLGGHNQQALGTLSTKNYTSAPYSFYSVPDNVSSGTRSEIQFEDSDTAAEGAVEWNALYEAIVPDSCHSLQFHPNTSGGSASPGLWHEGGKFSWVNWKGGTNTHYNTGITIQANRMYKFRLEYKIGSAGYLRWFIDGAKVFEKLGIQVGDGSGQYLKVGFNGWTSSARNSRIYYDDVKIYKKA